MSHFVYLLVEVIFSLALFVNALLFLPQVVQLLKTRDSAGLSLITFMGFNLIQLVTIFHAILFHDEVLMWGYLVSFVTCGAVTVLIVYYRRKQKQTVQR